MFRIFSLFYYSLTIDVEKIIAWNFSKSSHFLAKTFFFDQAHIIAFNGGNNWIKSSIFKSIISLTNFTLSIVSVNNYYNNNEDVKKLFACENKKFYFHHQVLFYENEERKGEENRTTLKKFFSFLVFLLSFIQFSARTRKTMKEFL